MKPYSLDLRQKIVDTYREGGISQRRLAEQFRVALSFVEKILKQDRETGSLAPKVRTKQTPSKVNHEQLETLRSLFDAHRDATLAELQELFEQATGVKIGRSTVGRLLAKLNVTRERKHAAHSKAKSTTTA